MALEGIQPTLPDDVTAIIREGVRNVGVRLDKAGHIPGAIYRSPALFQIEKEEIFMRDWLCVGRVEEVENPGDYMTLRVIDEPIVVTRDEDHNINAYLNICAHRGVEVVNGEGNARTFKCPYHGWTYDLSGRLVGAAYMENAGAFDASTSRLRPIRSAVWAGWIFVNFDENAEPLDAFVSEFDGEFGLLQQAKCRLGDKYEIELECNWKLVVENFMDIYHILVLHASSIGSEFPDPLEYPHKLLGNGGYSAFFHAAQSTPSGRSLLGKMPWLADEPDDFVTAGFLAPSFNMFAQVDCVKPIIVWPLSPTRSRLVQYTIFPEEFFARPDFEHNVKIYHDYALEILLEDRDLIGSLQNVMNSQWFEPGPMSAGEFLVHHYINAYLNRISRNNAASAAKR